MLLKVSLRPSRPRVRQPHRLLRPLIRRRMLHALVEHHHHVRTQRNLHLHRVFRRKEVLAPIQMRPKLHTLVRDLPQLAQRKHLKPARIGQHRPIPAHELVYPTHAPHQLMPRPQVQVIRIRQNNLRPNAIAPQLLERVLRYGLHRSLRPHRHKHRRLHRSMRQRQPPPPPAPVIRPQNLKTRFHSTSLFATDGREHLHSAAKVRNGSQARNGPLGYAGLSRAQWPAYCRRK